MFTTYIMIENIMGHFSSLTQTVNPFDIDSTLQCNEVLRKQYFLEVNSFL